MKFGNEILNLANALLESCRARGVTLATAESCTGGLIAGALTEIAGSSDVVLGGFMTYSNEMKHTILGVPQNLLDKYGAVSEAVAGAMAEGALRKSNAMVAVSITGIAGPGGGTLEKPIGLVYFGLANSQGEEIVRKMEYGSLTRNQIREASVNTALKMLSDVVVEKYNVKT